VSKVLDIISGIPRFNERPPTLGSSSPALPASDSSPYVSLIGLRPPLLAVKLRLGRTGFLLVERFLIQVRSSMSPRLCFSTKLLTSRLDSDNLRSIGSSSAITLSYFATISSEFTAFSRALANSSFIASTHLLSYFLSFSQSFSTFCRLTKSFSFSF